MKRSITKPSLFLLTLAFAILFAPQAGAVIACTSAQLADPAMKTYCDAQQALIDAQKLRNQALLDALKNKTPPSPH